MLSTWHRTILICDMQHLDHRGNTRAIAYGIFNESSLRTQGPQRERNCAHRGGADSRFCTGAEAFFSLLGPGVMGPCVRRDDPLRDCAKPQPSAEVGHMR